MAEKRARYEIYESRPDVWRWRLRGRNGRILASGEGFTRKLDVVRSLTTLIVAAVEASHRSVMGAE